MKRRNKYLNQECCEYKQHAGMVGLLFVVVRRLSTAGDGLGLVFSRSRCWTPAYQLSCAVSKKWSASTKSAYPS